MNAQQIALIIILIAALALLITERLRNDAVAVLIILALYLSGILKSEEALAGFGSGPAIVVVSIFVLSAALHQTGLSETIGTKIGQLAGSNYSRAIAVIMPTVALFSAFTHHVTTTAVMLPVTLNLSRERHIPASKLLMPLSFAASLGTTITIIGAPSFLIASNILQSSGHPALGIFSIAPIGLAISVVGTIFMLTLGRFLLPSHQAATDTENRFRLDNYFTELNILPNSPFLDKTLAEIKAKNQYQFTVVGWLRDGRSLRRPFGDRQIRGGDVLLVRTTPEDMVAFRQEQGIELHPVEQYGASPGNESQEDIVEQLVQVIIAPTADIIGRSLRELDFSRHFGAVVIGLWRREGFLDQELAKIKLRAGDVLVLQGDPEALERVENDPSFLMMVPFQAEARLRRKAPLAAVIMGGTILLAALNVVTLEMATLAGAALIVLTRCISPRQAYHAIDARIYVFIAGAIPLGAAMYKSGVSDLFAGWLRGAVGSWNEFFILLALFAVSGIVTQFLPDEAATAIFAPVAIALARALGHQPEAYVVSVAMGSVAAFFTPIGHLGDLLVYGPGRYKFRDFVKVGTPLTVLVGLVVALLAPLLWPS